MDNSALEEFIEEVEDILQDLEEGILLLEEQPRKRSLIDRLFRNMHTIKGGAGMVMQPELADYAHHLENLLDKARSGEIVCTPEMASLLLDSLDVFRSFMAKIGGTGEVNLSLIDKTQEQIAEFEAGSAFTEADSQEVKDAETKSKSESAADEQTEAKKSAVELSPSQETDFAENSKQGDSEKVRWDEEEEEDEKGYLLHLKFNQQMLRNGSDPMLLIKELKNLGDLTVFPHLGSLPELKNLDQQDLHLWWSAKLVTAKSPEDLEDVLIFYQGEQDDVSFEPVESPPAESDLNSMEIESQSIKKAQQPTEAAEQTEMVEKQIEVSSDEKPLFEQTKEQPQAKVEETTQETSTPSKIIPPGETVLNEPEIQKVHSIRVAVEKLDRLQNMVGESVINQSRLQQLSEQIKEVDKNLGELVSQFVEDNEKSVRELQDQILQVRMIPVGSIFTPMKRTVRDFANRNNKRIRLDIEGGSTELDKTLTEQLHGPLVHLVRNSMDHGIEHPETRQKNGKDSTGTILLKASHQEGYVIVEIDDDGKGIDSQAVFESALGKGLINKEDELSEQEIFQLLFSPGFTTASRVTDVSGRGVGMDTVKRDIEALLGTIEISSTPGKGTNVRMKLPLTLAIIEGMMINIGNQVFTIPLLSINEALRPQHTQVKKIKHKGELVEIRGEYIPLLRLHKRLNLKPRFKEPTEGQVLVVHHANRKQCLLVDEIIDQRPVVVKSMEDNFIQVPGIAGATILGDGSVSFILDVPSLVN